MHTHLTPALQSLISLISQAGPLQLSMVDAARCLVQPHFGILRAMLRDEFIAWRKVRKRCSTVWVFVNTLGLQLFAGTNSVILTSHNYRPAMHAMKCCK